MKVTVEVSAKDLVDWQAESLDEVKDWFKQALRHGVDTWDGGLLFLDGVNLEIKEV